MELQLEVTYLDGRVCSHAWPTLDEAYPGSIHREIDVRWDELETSGLIVECRHHFPNKTSAQNLDAQDDPRGDGCSLVQDAYYSVLDASELADVALITQNERVMAYFDENAQGLVSLSELHKELAPYRSQAEITGFSPYQAYVAIHDALAHAGLDLGSLAAKCHVPVASLKAAVDQAEKENKEDRPQLEGDFGF